jgi:hypothetical protein
MNRPSLSLVSGLLFLLFHFPSLSPGRDTLVAAEEERASVDLIIYGGTSAGIAAAVQAERMGLSTIVIEPTDRIGGLTTGGLGQTDIGNKSAIGGIALEFYQAIAVYYQQPDAWTWQRSDSYKSTGQSITASGESAMWTFEPSAALSVYESWVEENDISVVYGERLDRNAGVMMTRSLPARILGIRMESGDVFRGKMFIDATYEGDLLATAGVSYTVGREANSEYGETLNGVQTKQAVHHQLVGNIDPYVMPGNPSSGLVSLIDSEGPGEEGAADHRVQAYCYRMCLTDHPANRIPFHQPEGYRADWYELLFRNYEAGETAIPWINSAMPNRKTDTNNRTGFSTDFIGQNYDYPEASYERREQIESQHRLYQQGLMWSLANHPRVPEAVRNQVSKWGTCKDEFTKGRGWQDQLYVREARRMLGDYVMTQQNCQGVEVDDPIGLAAYTMDSHNQQRYVDENGHVRNEGDVQVGGFSPYGISYRSIVPKKNEVANLLVPVCLSSTHIAFGSIRMEPVFMVLGQTSATAAAIAIEDQTAVQNVDYEKLAERLVADQQVLYYTGPKVESGIDASTLSGIVVDNTDAIVQGPWFKSRSSSPRVGDDYLHDGNANQGQCEATYIADLPKPGVYQVNLLWPPYSNRASNVLVTVIDGSGEEHSFRVNQRESQIQGIQTTEGSIRGTPIKGTLSLGEFSWVQQATVKISNVDADNHVIADAVQFVPVNN